MGCNVNDKAFKVLLSRYNKNDRRQWFNPGPNECCFIACLANFLSKREHTDYHVTYERLYDTHNEVMKATFTVPEMEEILTYERLRATIYQVTIQVPPMFVGLMSKCMAVTRRVNDKTNWPELLLVMSEWHTGGFRHVIQRTATRFNTLEHWGMCIVCGKWIIGLQGRGKKQIINPHFEKCKKCVCGTNAREDGVHESGCPGRITNWSEGTLLRKSSSGTLSEMKESKKPDSSLKGQWFCDFEAADFGKGYHEVYLAVLKNIESDELEVYYGRNCMSEIGTRIMSTQRTSPHGYLWFHNGSGYDFNFLMSEVCKRTNLAEIPIIRKGTKIIGATIKGKPKLHLRDFFLFCQSSLKKLCADFKVPAELTKGEFDHSRVKTWDDLEEIKDEVVSYCKNDVLALEFIYKKFCAAMWEIAAVPPHKAMTIAGHAYSVWRTITPKEVVNEVHVPDRELYDKLRKCYFGGRVLPTVARYDSHVRIGGYYDFDESGVMENAEEFIAEMEENKDYLVMVDVVSLYPSIMKKYKMPSGKPSLKSFVQYSRAEEMWRKGVNSARLNLMFKVKMMRCTFLVDVTPPTDLLVAYLMEKGDDGTNVQNLNPKLATWYAGPDLYEAVVLGYVVTRIIEVIEYPKLEYAFATYVNKMFELKEANKKDKTSALYQGAKYLMNALSGKFGQKDVLTTTVMVKSVSEEFMDKHVDEIRALEFLDINDPHSGVMVELSNNEDEERRHATQLSVFILAHSRRVMSKMLRSIDGYKNSNNCFRYTDTDSMVLTRQAYDLIPAKYVGNGLGMLENEFPKSYIVSARFLAPKTYSLRLVTVKDEGLVLETKVRCKGIPHRGDIFQPRSYSEADWLEPHRDEGFIDLRKRWYYLYEDDTEPGEEEYTPFLDVVDYEKVLRGYKKVIVVYGSLDRSFLKNGVVHTCKIRPMWKTRNLSVENWWDKGTRLHMDFNLREVTTPVGYLHNDGASQELVEGGMDISQ